VTSGEGKTVATLADRLGLSRPTIRVLLGALGLIGGPGNQNKPGGITARTRPIKKQETRRQKRLRVARERDERRDAKAALETLKRQEAQQKAEADQAALGTPPGEPLGPAPVSEEPPIPPAGRGRRRVPQGPKARLPGAPTVEQAAKAGASGGLSQGQVDLLVAFAVPSNFDEVEWLRKIATAPWVDTARKVQALNILVNIRGSKGKVDWSQISAEQIPEDMRHRLAGMLLGWIDYAELPEVVRVAPLPCRTVFKLTGVLPATPEAAEIVLARWGDYRAQLRELAGEQAAPTTAPVEELDLELAAETAFTPTDFDSA
jgi:hypothetical protein